MMEQFFGTTTWRVFGGLALMTCLGALFLRVEEAHLVMLVFFFMAGAWSYWKRPELAFMLVFAELFAFSHGKLFEMEIGGFVFTSRMALFVGVMLSWGIMWLLKKRKCVASPVFWTPWVLLGIALLIGLVIGLVQNDPRAVLDDMNAYLFALYLLPLLSISWTRVAQRELIQTLVGSALWMSVLSLGLLYTFTHLPNEVLELTYKFIRDARIGEMTLMEGGYWRIFMQSQIVLIPTLLLVLAFDGEVSKTQQLGRKMVVLLAVLIAGLIISLSRSFWIGLVVAIPFLLFHLVRREKLQHIMKRCSIWMGSGVVAFGLLATMALTVFPVPSRVMSLQETFKSRTTEAGDLAVSSRWNLLPVMLEAMREAPVLGSGFGRSLAFVSDDPRVRERYPDGKWRTYKFEWGWLDLWVKMGALGFFAFVALFLTYDRLLRESLSQPDWLRLGLRASLLALVFTHLFSPYLNHPLGIGILLFVTAFLNVEERETRSFATVMEEKMKIPKIASPLPTTRTSDESCG